MPSVRRLLAPSAAVLACAALAGCATTHPAPLPASTLAEAQAFPFFPVYWAGRRFGSQPVVALDGLHGYTAAVGENVYYGDCAQGGSAASGGCVLPLQVTTSVYSRRANAPLGPQRNTVLRGVPAVIYDGGRSIELYTGRVAVDVAAEGLAQGLRAVAALRPLNAPGAGAPAPLPAPVYCPGITPRRPTAVRAVLASLPGKPCQSAARSLAVDRALFGKG